MADRGNRIPVAFLKAADSSRLGNIYLHRQFELATQRLLFVEVGASL